MFSLKQIESDDENMFQGVYHFVQPSVAVLSKPNWVLWNASTGLPNVAFRTNIFRSIVLLQLRAQTAVYQKAQETVDTQVYYHQNPYAQHPHPSARVPRALEASAHEESSNVLK